MEGISAKAEDGHITVTIDLDALGIMADGISVYEPVHAEDHLAYRICIDVTGARRKERTNGKY